MGSVADPWRAAHARDRCRADYSWPSPLRRGFFVKLIQLTLIARVQRRTDCMAASASFALKGGWFQRGRVRHWPFLICWARRATVRQKLHKGQISWPTTQVPVLEPARRCRSAVAPATRVRFLSQFPGVAMATKCSSADRQFSRSQVPSKLSPLLAQQYGQHGQERYP